MTNAGQQHNKVKEGLGRTRPNKCSYITCMASAVPESHNQFQIILRDDTEISLTH